MKRVPLRIITIALLAGLFVLGLGLSLWLSAPASPAAAAPAAHPMGATAPFTAEVSVVAMYPAMGDVLTTTGRPTGIQVPRGDDPKKTYALFSPGTSNVPPGVP